MTYHQKREDIAVTQIKKKNPIFYAADAGVIFRTKEREFVLKESDKNLYQSIREEVKEYFKQNKISWWGGKKPTGHVLSSQIACLNHLFPIRNDAHEVLKILKLINPDFIEPLIIQTDRYSPAYIQFEAISNIDHLNEGPPTRGTNCTSLDALMYALHTDGSRWLIPIEWKYVEAYPNLDKSKEGIKKNPDSYKGLVRQNRYNTLIKNSSQLNSYNSSWYYFEPFYQLMRQTLWMEQIIINKNTERLKANSFMHIHVVHPDNQELLGKNYKCSQKKMEETWRLSIRNQSLYRIIPPESLLGGISSNPIYTDLYKYLRERYW